jgi:hypothetical protein
MRILVLGGTSFVGRAIVEDAPWPGTAPGRPSSGPGRWPGPMIARAP